MFNQSIQVHPQTWMLNIMFCKKKITSMWFKVTFLYRNWRSHNLWNSHVFTIPKRSPAELPGRVSFPLTTCLFALYYTEIMAPKVPWLVQEIDCPSQQGFLIVLVSIPPLESTWKTCVWVVVSMFLLFSPLIVWTMIQQHIILPTRWCRKRTPSPCHGVLSVIF